MSAARKMEARAGEALDPEPAGLVVMKFGGTSVEDAEAILRTTAIVRGRRERGMSPVVVVSAMAKVTDQLLAAAAAAGRGDKAEALAIAARLRNRHIETAADLLSGELLAGDRCRHPARFDSLDDLLRGIAAVGELTPRTSDKVVSYGERMSSRMVAAVVCAAWAGWRACGRAEMHRYGRPLRQGCAAGGCDRGES